MRTVMAGLLALSLGGLALADDDKKPEANKPDTRAEKLKAIQKEMTDASQAGLKVFREAKTDEEKAAARTANSKAMLELRPRLAERAMALAKEDPKDDAAFDALAFAHGLTFGTPRQAEAVGLIREHHLANPKIVPLLPTLARKGRSTDTEFLKSVREKNPAKEVKGYVTYLLAQAIQQEAEGPAVKDADIQPKLTEAAAAMERVAAEYADVQVPGLRGKLGDMAKQAVAAIKKSPVGKPIQEIEGEDTDGAKFKISDYRGKVVLLDFWGHW